MKNHSFKNMGLLIRALAMLIVAGLLVGASASGASATDGSGSEIISSEATAATSTEASAESVNGISIHSTTQVVSYIQAKGATTTQLRGKSFRLQKSMTLWTSYYNTSHQEVWHWKTYPKGKKFVKGSDGWYHDPVCWNKVKVKTTKQVPASRKLYGAIKVVSSFVFQAKAKSAVNGSAKATAHAWCSTASSGADAYGSGQAVFSAAAYASASGRTWAEAKANASSSSGGKLRLEAGTETDIKIRLKTQAEGNASAEASAKVTCSTAPPTVAKPDLIEISTINDVLVNNTRTIDVSGTVAPGHTATLFCTSVNGGSITAGKSQSVPAGSFSKQLTYKAPSEVPGANGNIPAGHDRVDCTLTQDDGQSDQISTNAFEIRPAPVDPA